MKKLTLLLCILLFGAPTLVAQITPAVSQDSATTHSHAASASMLIPFGEFSKTHVAGLSIGHSWSHHRFGTDSVTHKKFGFIVSSGVEFLLGKEIRTAGYDFRYGNYLSIYSMPGVVYQPVKKGLISLNAGPFLSIYKGNTYAGIGASFQTQYTISKNIAIGPGLVFKKRPETNALWMVALQGVYAL